jgi:poly-gamma-glutamate synthesis protein (capsule biosynthesis protein)
MVDQGRRMAATVTLGILGDLMLGGEVSEALRNHPPDWFWGDTLPVLRRADAVIANLEGPITTNNVRWRYGWKMFHYRADPAAVRVLRSAGVGFVCLANNHMLDYGAAGLLDTLDALDAAGIGHAGAGRILADAAAPSRFELPGLSVGLIAATDNMRGFAAGPDRPGTNYLAIDDAPGTLDWIERSAAALRRSGVGFVVLSLHWGPNMRCRPNRRFRRFAHAAIERGVDLIHGHSAHVVQAVERYGRGLVLYDTGNIIDDYWKFPFRQTTSSFLFLLDLEDGRPLRLRLLPVRIRGFRPELATGTSFRAITRRMIRLCAAVGTQLVARSDGLELPLA